MYSFERNGHVSRAEQFSSQQNAVDLLVIGGGATGIGIAVDAASRGYSVCVLEQSDFGKGTSSRSTKLVHGGVRYLKQGNISLVREALYERALLLKNAPHVVRELPFIIPCPNQWQAFFYGTGLKVYDLLAGKHNFSPSRRLGRQQVIERIATMQPKQCTAGILYYDGQFDDTRLLLNLAQTASQHGAVVLNYARVVGLMTESDRVVGARWLDQETGREHACYAKVVINATGPFCDEVRRMDQPDAQPMVAASQGIHLVLPKRFLPGSTAIMVPKTADGRVVFMIPWHDHVVLGTTDTPIQQVSLEPTAQASEIEFLLETITPYLNEAPQRSDVQSVFTGIRPLVVANPGAKTSKLPRDHAISISQNKLITITGGKWTTYRKMAEDCVDRAVDLVGLEKKACRTHALPIAGATKSMGDGDLAHVYGTDEPQIQQLGFQLANGNQPIDSRLSVTPAQVIWAARHEMARTVEDVLARRTRSLFLHARASIDIAPQVASLMRQELQQAETWESTQLQQFKQTAAHFDV